MLEYFDFFLFAHFSFILAPLFYPPISPGIDSIIHSTFFAIGFLARPLGAFIFGKIADIQGRKPCLMMTVIGITIPTLIIGLLPTYNQIGILAPIILIICRVFQGIAVGGEFNNGAILLMESFGWKKAGTMSGYYNAASGTGSLLAILCIMIVTKQDMPTWVWRVPFFIAAILGLVGFYLRQFIKESPEFLHFNKKKVLAPAKLMPQHFKAFWVGAVSGVLIWIPLSFTSMYMTKVAGFSLQEGIKITTLAILLHNITTFIMGKISDKVGLWPMFFGALLFAIINYYPCFILLQNKHFVLFQVLTVIPAGVVYAVLHPLISYDVPPHSRGRVVGFSFSLGLSLFAGLTPMITSSILYMGNGKLTLIALYVITSIIAAFVMLRKYW
jgi:MHS family proline/betaine transporter-like MFS transporter